MNCDCILIDQIDQFFFGVTIGLNILAFLGGNFYTMDEIGKIIRNVFLVKSIFIDSLRKTTQGKRSVSEIGENVFGYFVIIENHIFLCRSEEHTSELQ